MRGKQFERFSFVLFLMIASGILVTSAALPVAAQTRSLITSPVDNQSRVTIPRSTHPLAKAEFSIGALDGSTAMERMILVLGESAEQEHQLRTFLDSQQTKGSPDYHHWLTPEEFGQKFGPSPQDIAQVTGWLQRQGFGVGNVARSGRWIEFSGTAAQVEAAFQTQMRTYQVGGQMHLANASDMSIPAALSPVVRGVASLHDFFKKPMLIRGPLVRRTADGLYVPVNPDTTLQDGSHAIGPGDFANIYNLNPLYTASPTPFNGTGQTIAIVARSNIALQDVLDFRQVFGLSGSNLNVILNGLDPGDVPGDDIEAILDTEWSGAVAPNATVDVVVSSSTLTTDGVDLSAAFIVDNNLAAVMSVSFGQCEANLTTAENSFLNALWKQAAAQGISVFVSSGDNGAAGCDDPNTTLATGGLAVSGLASTPFNTAVGGTQFNETGNVATNDATFWNTTNTGTFVSAKGYIPEMVWNESQGSLFAGSGGLSTIYGTPSWQSLNITGLTGSGFTKRALPDVSLTAASHDGYLICFQLSCEPTNNPGFFIIGGTSPSSQSFAGIMAIIDQKVVSRQGLANYVLYPLAAAESQSPGFTSCNSSSRIDPAVAPLSACVFNDTTVGNNSVPGQTGFNAGVGYDLATGLGSVNATNLVNAWAAAAALFQGSQTTLSATANGNPAPSISIMHGQPVVLTVNVQKAGGGAGPTGNVAVVTDQAGPVAGMLTVGAGSLTNGSFTGTFSNLPGGSYNLSANYPGDGTFASSNSSNITTNVTAESSMITLAASLVNANTGTISPLSPVQYGDPINIVFFDSAVAGASGQGFPSGDVTLKDSSTVIGQSALNSSARVELANCFAPLTCLTPGTHSITASYLVGDSSFNASGPSAAVAVTITKANPSVALTVPANAVFNQQITLQAQVQNTGPINPSGGIVTFFDGATQLGLPQTVPATTPGTTPPTESIQVTLAPGSHSVTAQYNGDAIYNSATSAVSTVVVAIPFSFSATTASQTIAAGGTATYNVTLTANNGFTGSVSFACSGAPGGATCTVAPNPANLTVSTTSVPLMVTVSNTQNALLTPAPLGALPFVFAAMFAVALCGARGKPRQALFMVLAVFLIVGLSSCGGGSSPPPPPPPPPPPTNATLTVTGTSGSATNTIALTLTITH